jgi:acetoin utilization deacetylase AcuC-like enzyme
MTLVYDDPRFLWHETGHHPESPARLAAVREWLARDNWHQATRISQWSPADLSLLATLHDSAYLAALAELAARGGGQADADTVVCPRSVEVAQLGVGAAIDATRRVLAGESRTAFAAIRPPGHHALADRAMGFCLYANVALAAQWAIDQGGLDRVLIVDWDVHHGNGTQALFYNDPRVAFLSMHRYPFWPGTGSESETGTGRGLGATRNLPVALGTSRDRILSWLAREVEDFAARHKPQLVLLSAGFDAHRTDPVGGLGLEVEDFGVLTDIVLDVAATHADGRLVSLLEGGYEPAVLAECVSEHLRCLVEREGELSSAVE